MVQTKRTWGTLYHSGLVLGSTKYYPAEGRAMASYTPYRYACLLQYMLPEFQSKQNNYIRSYLTKTAVLIKSEGRFVVYLHRPLLPAKAYKWMSLATSNNKQAECLCCLQHKSGFSGLYGQTE